LNFAHKTIFQKDFLDRNVSVASLFFAFTLVLTGLVLTSCKHSGGDESKRQTQSEDSTRSLLPSGAKDAFIAAPNRLFAIQSDGSWRDVFYELSQCQCAKRKSQQLLRQMAVSSGVLPQLLVPEIRKSIQQDQKLQFLNSLPSGLSDVLKNWLASDAKIAEAVRSSIATKIGKTLNASRMGVVSQDLPFKLDLFLSSGSQGNSTNPGAVPPMAMFAAADQSARWNLVSSLRDLYQGNQGVEDATLTTLEMLRLAAEWTYILGIDGEGKPANFGGLAYDVRIGAQRPAAPADPSQLPDDSGLFIAGDYTMSFSNLGQVKETTSLREVWQSKADQVPLMVQAKIWLAAAGVLSNLRYDQNKMASVLLSAPEGALSPGMQKLPLVWLSGMKTMLSKLYIHASTHDIYTDVYGQKTLARLQDLIALGEAANAWRAATTNLGASGLSPAIVQKLMEAPQKMLTVTQLTVQAVMALHTYTENVKGSEIVTVGQKGVPASLLDQARTISLFINLERSVLTSDHLKQFNAALVSGLNHSLAKGGTVFDAATTLALFRVYSEWQASGHGSADIGNIRANLEKALSDWEVR
jgi:hypothetical protein